MKHTHGEGVLVLALLAAFAACADPASRTVAPSSSSDVLSGPASAPVGEERAALTKIARLVAVAMDNEPARQHLKRDMRAAPFREHKLELKSYLQSKDGRALLDRMAVLAGGESVVFGALAQTRQLEFYMPVAKQRESWTGNADVLVVSQLDESQPIVSFDESGREVTLSRNTPPDQPTLSIVPVETRFDQPMPASTSRNVRDQNGNAIGTIEPLRVKSSSLIACDVECGGDGGGGGTVSSGGPPKLFPQAFILRSREFLTPRNRGSGEIRIMGSLSRGR